MAGQETENSEKFARLYNMYAKSLIGYAISIVKSPIIAEELVHDAYVKILQHIQHIEDPCSIRTKRYLIVTVRNICFDYLRQFVPIQEMDDYEDFSSNVQDAVWADFSIREFQQKLGLFLTKLPESDRRLFIDFITGFHYKELAEKYSLTEKNVSVKIFRLRGRFRRFLSTFDEKCP